MPCPWRGHLPFSGRRKAILPAHSPNIAGVRPVNGFWLCIPARGQGLDHLEALPGIFGDSSSCQKPGSTITQWPTHPVLLLAGWARRLALCARESLVSECAVPAVCMLTSGASELMSTSSILVGVWPVTIIRPALSSALDSLIRSTAGGTDWSWPLCNAASLLLWYPDLSWDWQFCYLKQRGGDAIWVDECNIHCRIHKE